MKEYLKLFETHADYEAYAQSGDMLKPNVSYCENDDEVHYNPFSYAEEYLTFVALEDGTFTFSTNAVSYSLDNGETWTELAAATASPTVTVGKKIMWKGALTPISNEGIGTFSATGNFNVQGNAMSLLYGNNFKGQTDLTGKNYAFYELFSNNTKVINAEKLSLPATTLASQCYRSMFDGCTSLATAPELPATTLATSCYYNMFRGCTALTTAPELSATTLATGCYCNMFQGCTGLTVAPELPATTLALTCYSGMFQGCTSLTTVPELPATTLLDACYAYMFSGCTSLTTAPELPAATLAWNCYQSMFNGCTSLTTAPELPVSTLEGSCYQSMFSGCTSLTTAPELPATTLVSQCYQYMFDGCTSLSNVKCLATDISANNCTGNWLRNVSSTGTFIKNTSMTSWATGVSGIPTGWTVQDAS